MGTFTCELAVLLVYRCEWVLLAIDAEVLVNVQAVLNNVIVES